MTTTATHRYPEWLWRTLYDHYMASEAWARKREQVFARYGRRCWECHNAACTLQVHHLRYPPPWLFGWEPVEWCRPLCSVCHQRKHPGRHY